MPRTARWLPATTSATHPQGHQITISVSAVSSVAAVDSHALSIHNSLAQSTTPTKAALVSAKRSISQTQAATATPQRAHISTLTQATSVNTGCGQARDMAFVVATAFASRQDITSTLATLTQSTFSTASQFKNVRLLTHEVPSLRVDTPHVSLTVSVLYGSGLLPTDGLLPRNGLFPDGGTGTQSLLHMAGIVQRPAGISLVQPAVVAAHRHVRQSHALAVDTSNVDEQAAIKSRLIVVQAAPAHAFTSHQHFGRVFTAQQTTTSTSSRVLTGHRVVFVVQPVDATYNTITAHFPGAFVAQQATGTRVLFHGKTIGLGVATTQPQQTFVLPNALTVRSVQVSVADLIQVLSLVFIPGVSVKTSDAPVYLVLTDDEPLVVVSVATHP